MGVHVLDTFAYFVGPAERVMAFSRPAADGSTLDQATIVSVEYASGPIASVGTSSFSPPVQLLTAYGTLRNAWNERDGHLFTQGLDDADRLSHPFEPFDTIVDELREFAGCIRGEAAPETGGAEGLEVATVMQGIAESLRSGAPVRLADLESADHIL